LNKTFELVLKNSLPIRKGQFFKRNIGISNGKIMAITEEELFGDKVIDCKQKMLLPGLIDSHVHLRVPGMSHKEDWAHGTRAALAGGITTVLDMPNTLPPATTRQLLEEKREAVKKEALCNFGLHFGATNDNFAELKRVEGAASVKVFMGSSTGSLLVRSESALKRIFEIAKKKNMVVTVHAEDEEIVQLNTNKIKQENKNHAKYHNEARPAFAERIAIEKALMIQKETGNKIHFLHVSTEEGISVISDAKKQGSGITCEATPHHLFLTEEDTEALGNFGKMNPPLRTREDQKALWKAVNNGTVDCIGTDHAPHTIEEKEKDYFEAPSGVPGLETMLPLLLDAVAKEKLTMARLVEMCCENPARIFSISEKGLILNGFDADLVLVDLAGETIILNELLETKCRWSPFYKWKLKGKIEKVFVSGKEFEKNKKKEALD